MTPQQAEALYTASVKIRQNVDRVLAQRTPEQKQQELDRLVKEAHRFLGQVRQTKGGGSVLSQGTKYAIVLGIHAMIDSLNDGIDLYKDGTYQEDVLAEFDEEVQDIIDALKVCEEQHPSAYEMAYGRFQLVNHRYLALKESLKKE